MQIREGAREGRGRRAFREGRRRPGRRRASFERHLMVRVCVSKNDAMLSWIARLCVRALAEVFRSLAGAVLAQLGDGAVGVDALRLGHLGDGDAVGALEGVANEGADALLGLGLVLRGGAAHLRGALRLRSRGGGNGGGTRARRKRKVHVQSSSSSSSSITASRGVDRGAERASAHLSGALSDGDADGRADGEKGGGGRHRVRDGVHVKWRNDTRRVGGALYRRRNS